MRLTDNEFHTKESKERARYVEESRIQAIYDKLFDLEDIEDKLGIDLIKSLKALEIIKDYLYIDDKNTLRLRNTTNVNLVGIVFSDREVIDLLKEVFKYNGR